MKLTWIKIFLLGATVLALFAHLYTKSSSVKFAEHDRYERGLQRLKQLDTSFNVDVLKARYRLLNNYDGFAEQLRESSETLGDLRRIPVFVASAGQARLGLALTNFSRLLAQKQESIEEFKTQNSVVRNSLAYFPTAGSELVRKASVTPDGRELQLAFDELMRVILVYSLTAQEELEPQIQMSIGKVRAWADANPAHADADIVLGLVAHARTLLLRKPKVDALTSRLVSLPTGTEADAMLRTYQQEFARALQVTQTYRLALFLCCVALLGGIAWAIRALRQSNLHLEHRVRERTSELSGKNTELQTEIADRKKAEEERQRMEVQLRHAQKMESIGQLAAGIAHEINTPTQFIGDNTRFIRDSFGDLKPLLDAQTRLLAAAQAGPVPPTLLAELESAAKTADVDYLSEEIPKALGQSLDGIERVTNIVRAMKEFSHPGTTEKTALNLNRAIESTLTVCCSEWKYVAEMVTDFDVTLPSVPVLPGEFNQVVLNIVINATHAIADVVGDGSKGKGAIKVSTRRDGDWAELRIGDTGTGIPESTRVKVFDPFFTTKGVGKGTGQGLAIAHNVVVEKHGGTIHFETETGKGTTFVIRLPLQSASQERKAA